MTKDQWEQARAIVWGIVYHASLMRCSGSMLKESHDVATIEAEGTIKIWERRFPKPK